MSAELAEKPAFELKGRMTSVTILRVYRSDLDAIEAGMRVRIDQAPNMFKGAPLAIDLKEIAGVGIDLPELVRRIRLLGIAPVGISGAGPALRSVVADLNLGWLDWGQDAPGKARAVRPEPPKPGAHDESKPQSVAAERASPLQAGVPEPKAEDTPAVAPRPDTQTKLVTQPVRSGQRLYARHGDLLVLGQVSTGAEVISDGHVHIYGALRGRALAGARGFQEARIFCTSLEAELIAIAGTYTVAEELEEWRGKAVQVYLRGDKLVVEPF